MTEEIIIDGVNVAECYYMYDNEDLDYMCQDDAGTCICRENKNCYYKQLKRLETENAKLQKIKEICEEAIRLCDCPDADANYDCIDCTEGGRASLAKEIMEVMKDE